MYFRFKKIEQINDFYEEKYKKADQRFESVLNRSAERVKQYWQRSVYSLFCKVVFGYMKARVSQEENH